MPSNPVIEVDISAAIAGFEKLLAMSPQMTTQAMYTASEHVLVPGIKQRLRDQKSVFRGQLISRITTRAKIVGGNPTIEFGAHGVKYGLLVEEGSKPRKVSDSEFQKLVEYAKKKLGFRSKVPSRRVRRSAAGTRRGGGGTLTRFTVSAADVAEAIKKTIEKEGNAAHPYIMPVWDARRTAFVKDVVRRLRANLGTTT